MRASLISSHNNDICLLKKTKHHGRLADPVHIYLSLFSK
jgi:hypothetical protein